MKATKRFIALALFLASLMALAGCGKSSATTDGSLSVSTGEDLNNDQYYLGSSIYRNIAEGPDAFYFYSGDFLYYMDKKTLEVAPLCSKPECNHAAETEDYEMFWSCAAAHSFPTFIGYYNGGIYMAELPKNTGSVSNPTQLNRYDLQGVLEKEVTTLPNSAGSIIQHQGTLYYTYYGLDEKEDDYDWGEVYFMSCDLETGEEKTIATWPGTEVFSAGDTFVYGDNIYIRIDRFSDPEKFLFAKMYAIYNTKTEKLTYLESEDELASMSTAFIYNDKLIYSEYKADEYGNAIHNYCRNLYMAELDGSNPHIVSETKYDNGVCCVFDDIIIESNVNEGTISETNPETFAVYKDFELIGEFDLSSVKWSDGTTGVSSWVQCFVNAGDYILLRLSAVGNGYQSFAAVKKSDLQNGKAEPVLVFEPFDNSDVSFDVW